MKIVVVNAYGRSNRGDSVLLDECLSEIRSQYSNAQITVAVFEGIEEAQNVHSDVYWSERIGNTSGGGLISKLKTLWFILVCWLAVVLPLIKTDRFLPISQRKTFNAMRECDMVISAPGGYIHDTNFAYLVALFHIHLGTRMRKIVVLAPQSIGPLDRVASRWAARRILSKVPYLCPRESYSFDFLINVLGISPTQIYKTGDSAFWNDEIETDRITLDAEIARLGLKISQRIFGITVVGWDFPKHSNPAVAYDSYISAMAKIVDHIASQYQLTPVIFNQVSDDLPTAYLVRQKAKCHVIIDDKSHEPRVLRALIKRSTVFVGTRFHSCIFSMMAGRPTFAIAYLPKTEFIMMDLNLQSRHTSINSLNADQVIAQLSMDLENLSATEAEIAHAITIYRKDFARLQHILQLTKLRGNAA